MGQSVTLQAAVTRDGVPLTSNLVVTADVIKPMAVLLLCIIRRRRTHDDRQAGDGVYAGQFSGTFSPGEYVLKMCRSFGTLSLCGKIF